jgi:hypothetical protein
MRACTKNDRDRDRNEKRRIRLKNVMKIREKTETLKKDIRTGRKELLCRLERRLT